MCGIAGIINLKGGLYAEMKTHLSAMNALLRHRGPDGEDIWVSPDGHAGMAHCRLSIIDLENGAQPMRCPSGNVLVFNGEIYNYIELREELKDFYEFRTFSDTEVILAAYRKWDMECVEHFRGMFAFALWDKKRGRLFCARDRFGIKPFYYTIAGDCFYFASEMKALIPFLPEVRTDYAALKDYLAFQFVLGDKTLFSDIHQLPPAHFMTVNGGGIKKVRYWEVYFEPDMNHTERYFIENTQRLLYDSVRLHLRSDVPVGSYVSGGMDSGIVAAAASEFQDDPICCFNGRFPIGSAYDESSYARDLCSKYNAELHVADIGASDFSDSISDVIYQLDAPVAGPGAFPQYHVSKLASEHRKVVLGGQGGDEIFGGYARYIIAYFEQCIKGAIDGTLYDGDFIVTYESIIPNLRTLKEYVPLLKSFWKKGLFEPLDKRYFRLIDRAATMDSEINWNSLRDYSPYENFREIFLGHNVSHKSYFDLMTHFDFKTLLPALLQVEDRMSMAHGLEARVPFLDHSLIEFAATVPSNVKFKGGTLKRLLRKSFSHLLPESILQRRDKMGFPVPLSEWFGGELHDFVCDIFSSAPASGREFFNSSAILESISREEKFGRKIWGLLSLELWMRRFHDRHYEFKNMLKNSA